MKLLNLNFYAIFFVLFSSLLFNSCNENVDESIDINSQKKLSWREYFDTKAGNWTISSDNQNNVYASERAKSCGWEGSGTIDCSGGDCFLTTSVPGFAVCIGCTVSDEVACLSGPNGDILVLIAEMLDLYPEVEITHKAFDSSQSILGESSGELEAVYSQIINMVNNPDANEHYVRLANGN
jgi:hypothetical protein